MTARVALLVILLLTACASAVDETIGLIGQPATDDSFHECVLAFLSLFANKSIDVTDDSGKSISPGLLSGGGQQTMARSGDAVTISERQIIMLTTVCSMTEEQVLRWTDMRLDCAENIGCDEILRHPVTYLPLKGEED